MKLITAAACVLSFFCFESCEKPVSQKPATVEEANYESLVQEKDSPLMFMDVEAKIKKAESGESKDRQMLYGTISNTAMTAKFKDVTLAIKYYSRENDLIESTDIVVYNFYEPNTRTKFEVSIDPPDSMITFDVEVKDAKATDQ